ncbi:hypothetical protein KUTeg_010497 [Tegillarca granosa]|uniref:Uncharacterized protein n=1 Tax=Tegillarca granosa TaxID=220873 RepID=A0ABQ9F3G6_TEGGR|nr:hypothetical protein KUTeg_010497 [Tegillarca granosa]
MAKYESQGKSVIFKLSDDITAKVANEFEFYLDIKKYITNISTGKEVPTKVSLRLNKSGIEQMEPVLYTFLKDIEEKRSKVQRIIKMSRRLLIVREIQGLLKSRCHACRLDDPSQEHHMGINGCMQDWEDSVEMFFDGVMESGVVNDGDIVRLAEKIASSFKEHLYCPYDTEAESEESMKRFISDNNNLGTDTDVKNCSHVKQFFENVKIYSTKKGAAYLIISLALFGRTGKSHLQNDAISLFSSQSILFLFERFTINYNNKPHRSLNYISPADVTKANEIIYGRIINGFLINNNIFSFSILTLYQKLLIQCIIMIYTNKMLIQCIIMKYTNKI